MLTFAELSKVESSRNNLIFSEQQYTISVLGREEGYTVKYTPSSEGVPEGEARGNSSPYIRISVAKS